MALRLYRSLVARRSRIPAFGAAAALVIAGGACAALVGGVVGEVLTIVLISLGLTGGVLLVFLEVGLSEERELEREEARRRKRQRKALSARWRPRLRQRPRRRG
jgi:fatty acid desaturase